MRKILYIIVAAAVLGIFIFYTYFWRMSPPVPPDEQISSGGCAVGGCSGQICAEAGEAAGIVTTCEFRAEYACYRNARCERQPDNRCGWTQTEELRSCLKNPAEIQ